MTQNDTPPNIAETLRRAINTELWSVSDYYRGLLAFVQETHDQHAATNARLSAFEQRTEKAIADLTKRLDNHVAAASEKVREFEFRLTTQDTRLDDHKERLNDHKERLNALEAAQYDHAVILDTIPERMDASNERHDKTEARLDVLETTIQGLHNHAQTPEAPDTAPSNHPEPPDPEDFHRLPTEDVNELRAYVHRDGKYKIRPNHTNDKLCWEIFYKNTDPQNIITWHFWGYYSSFYLAINAVRKLAEEQWNSDNYFIRQSERLYGWQTKDENWIIYKNGKVWIVECQKVNLRGFYNSLPEAAKFVRDNSLVWEENPSMNHGERKAWKAENIQIIPSVEPTEFFIVSNTKSYHIEWFKYTSEDLAAAWNYAQTLTKKYVPEIPKD